MKVVNYSGLWRVLRLWAVIGLLLLSAWLTKISLESPTSTRENQPTLECLNVMPERHHFGQICQTEPLIGYFNLRNSFSETVTITDILKSCSCADVTVEPMIIVPGGTAKLAVVWKVANRFGNISENISLTYSRPSEPNGFVLANLSAVHHSPIEFEPKRIVISPESPEVQSIRIYQYSKDTINVKHISCNSDQFTVEYLQSQNTIRVRRSELLNLKELTSVSISVFSDSKIYPYFSIPVVYKDSRRPHNP